jgi:hypothetical protein
VKTQLLCTFTNEESFESIVNTILKTHELFSRKIFILKLEPSKELVISYNIIPTNENSFLPNTIMVHRKKESNTMYTINALNRLISDLNGGVVDKSFQINWDIYRNSVILTNGDSYKVLKTSLFRIVDVQQ